MPHLHRGVCVCVYVCKSACTQGVCVQECKVVCVRAKQLQLPAWEDKLPVASLQTAAGQPRYQPISYVEAECRKLAWLPLGAKLSNIMRQHDKFIWGYERGGEKELQHSYLSFCLSHFWSLYFSLASVFSSQFLSFAFICELILPLYAKAEQSDMTDAGAEGTRSSIPKNCEGYVERVCSCSMFTRGTKAPS